MAERIAVHTIGNGTTLALTRYEPFESQRPHSHERPSESFVLAGSLEETSGESRIESGCLSGVHKPARLEHANRFGALGAVLIQITAPRGSPSAEWVWASTPRAIPWMALGLALLGQGAGVSVEWAVPEAVRSVREARRAPGAPKAWLDDARDALMSECAPGIDELATRHGVHRVHLGREFRARFGLSPSEFRARRRVTRAMDLLWGRSRPSLAAVAVESGFADQSHMTREFRRWLGVTPASCRRALASMA